MQSDLLKASDQKPVDQEQFLIQESLASDLEKTIVRVDEMMHNGVNIQRMIKDIERLRDDVEKLKDAVSIRQEFAEWLLREDKEVHHDIVSLQYMGEGSEFD